MILLDTNVVSELLRSQPSAHVVAWADTLDAQAVCIAAVSAAELYRGTALLPVGRRRSGLEGAISRIIADVLGGRVLAFDLKAARFLGERYASASGQGTRPSMIDALIGATALAQDAMVATRDVEPFAAMGVRVVDPWSA